MILVLALHKGLITTQPPKIVQNHYVLMALNGTTTWLNVLQLWRPVQNGKAMTSKQKPASKNAKKTRLTFLKMILVHAHPFAQSTIRSLNSATSLFALTITSGTPIFWNVRLSPKNVRFGRSTTSLMRNAMINVKLTTPTSKKTIHVHALLRFLSLIQKPENVLNPTVKTELNGIKISKSAVL